jgi:hypothetical protein
MKEKPRRSGAKESSWDKRQASLTRPFYNFRRTAQLSIVMKKTPRSPEAT